MEVTAVEERCDRRIELLTQSIKKSRKRARIERIEEDDKEWVPSVFLHAEQTKVRVSELGTNFPEQDKNSLLGVLYISCFEFIIVQSVTKITHELMLQVRQTLHTSQ